MHKGTPGEPDSWFRAPGFGVFGILWGFGICPSRSVVAVTKEAMYINLAAGLVVLNPTYVARMARGSPRGAGVCAQVFSAESSGRP